MSFKLKNPFVKFLLVLWGKLPWPLGKRRRYET